MLKTYKHPSCGLKSIKPLGAILIVILGISAARSTFSQSPPRSGGWVVIGVNEYRALRAEAYPALAGPEGPPVDATLSRVDYDLQVTGDLATGDATLAIDVLKEGWARIGIPPGLLVKEARLDGKPVSLVTGTPGKGAEQLSAVLTHAGRATLQLKLAVPVASNAGDESVTLPPSLSGVVRAAVTLPSEGIDVVVNGGLLADKPGASNGKKWIAYGRGNEPLTFTWRRKTEDHRSTQALRMRNSLTELVALGEESATVTTEVGVQVTQGLAREVALQVPDSVTVNQVSGAMVADWAMKSGELHITFLEPTEQGARFVISGEVKAPREGMIAIPVMRLLDSEKEAGGVAVEILGAGEIKEVQKEGLDNADASDLGPMVANRESPALAAFRYRGVDGKSNRSLSVNVARYTPQAVLMANVEEARYEVLASSEGKTLVQARYAVRNNQRNFLKVVLPPGATLWSAALDGRPVRPGQAPDGSILLPLSKARSGEDAPAFAVELAYFSRVPAWTDKGQFRFALPAVDLPISRSGLRLYHPPRFHVTVEQGPFRTETYADPSSPALAEGFTRLDLYSKTFQPPPGPPPPPPPGGPMGSGIVSDQAARGREGAAQALVDQYRSTNQGSRVTGILPIRVDFPAFGSFVYMVSELTSENQSLSAVLSYQKEKKGGVR